MKIRLRSAAFVAAMLVSTVAAAFMLGPAAPTSTPTDDSVTTSVTSNDQGPAADSVAVLAAEASIGAIAIDPLDAGNNDHVATRTSGSLDHSTIIPIVQPNGPMTPLSPIGRARRIDSVKSATPIRANAR